MASYLADTNILLRLADTPSPQNPIAARAVAALFREQHEVFITAQNIIEFWAVATRPRENNGFGWSCEHTRVEVQGLREKFPLVKRNVRLLGEAVRQGHQIVTAEPAAAMALKHEYVNVLGDDDARLVAVLKTHGVDHLLTFNSGDFALFKDISIVDPQSLVTSSLR